MSGQRASRRAAPVPHDVPGAYRDCVERVVSAKRPDLLEELLVGIGAIRQHPADAEPSRRDPGEVLPPS